VSGFDVEAARQAVAEDGTRGEVILAACDEIESQAAEIERLRELDRKSLIGINATREFYEAEVTRLRSLLAAAVEALDDFMSIQVSAHAREKVYERGRTTVTRLQEEL